MSQRNKALLLTVVVLLAVVLVALLLFLRAALDYKGTVEAITIQEVDLSQVADGTYTGSCDAGLVSAQVAVTVEDGAITEVTLTDYHSILGRGAEAIPKRSWPNSGSGWTPCPGPRTPPPSFRRRWRMR